MILFSDEFKLFFNDSSLQKIADKCLSISLDAFNVNNGNIPKWTIALDELKASRLTLRHISAIFWSGESLKNSLNSSVNKIIN